MGWGYGIESQGQPVTPISIVKELQRYLDSTGTQLFSPYHYQIN